MIFVNKSVIIYKSFTFQLGLDDLSAYPFLEKWYKNCEELPGFDENKVGAEWLADILKAKNKTLNAPVFT